jgi:hypothetical protein
VSLNVVQGQSIQVKIDILRDNETNAATLAVTTPSGSGLTVSGYGAAQGQENNSQIDFTLAASGNAQVGGQVLTVNTFVEGQTVLPITVPVTVSSSGSPSNSITLIASPLVLGILKGGSASNLALSINRVGDTSTATLGAITGLPSGITPTFTAPTLGNTLSVAFVADGSATPGRLVVTVPVSTANGSSASIDVPLRIWDTEIVGSENFGTDNSVTGINVAQVTGSSVKIRLIALGQGSAGLPGIMTLFVANVLKGQITYPTTSFDSDILEIIVDGVSTQTNFSVGRKDL